MTKRLNEADIMNELKGNSAFFHKAEPQVVSDPPLPSQPRQDMALSAAGTPTEQPAPILPTLSPVTQAAAPKNAFQEPDQKKETPQPNSASTLASKNASKLTSYHDSIIEIVRKTVKQSGREPVFVRVTPEEKKQLADITYIYKSQGVKTSDNEISRIAINYLLEDYKTNGEVSVLAKVLASLLA